MRLTFEVLGRLITDGMTAHEINTGQIFRELDDLDSTDKGMVTSVRSILAKEQSRKTSRRVRAARASEREKARTTGLAVTAKVPAWLRAEKGKKTVVIPEHAKTVARIFELAGLGLGAKKIVRNLEGEKRRPFGRNTEWSPEYVQKILRSRAVLGEYAPHRLVNGRRVPVGEPIADFYPPVVTPTAFDAARKAVEAKTRFRKDGRRGYGGGKFNPNLLFSSVYDFDNKVKMYHNPGRRKGDYARLESRWQSRKQQHSVRLEEFEAVMLRVLPALDWEAIASEGESEEVRKAQAELDAVLGEIDRHNQRLGSLEKLVAEGRFSRSLFETLDAEKLALGDLSVRQEKLARALAEARSKVAPLHSPEELIAAIRPGTKPELRLRLKAEIDKRLSRIDLFFRAAEEEGLDYLAVLRFVNRARWVVSVRRGGASVTGGDERLTFALLKSGWPEEPF